MKPGGASKKLGACYNQRMSGAQNHQNHINFLYEMGSIRHIQRTWTRFAGAEFANLAEHHFHVFWIAMIIAAHEKNVDSGKIAKMVMVHDISESRTGDVDYLSRQYVIRNEELGIQDMLHDTKIEQEFTQLWHEYEKRESLEAKIVKDADTLNVDFELMEQATRGNNLRERWSHRSKVAESLYTQTAKQLYAQLMDSDPHAWHINGRNRINDGDWKKL
jgi:5'-deoxynucleotidase YfbR-like HD superfamily hydrolase